MKPLKDRLLPAPRRGGFRCEGYFVWCPSVIKAGGEFHMFASRWPISTGFPEGYRRHSEIVRAVSGTPEGPYRFEEVVLSARGGDWWDGMMCHNPKVYRTGDTFVLYYIGSDRSGRLLHGKNPFRQMGYATAPSVHGPWKRVDTPIPLGEDMNNPAALVHRDGRILLAYRDWALRMYLATAPTYAGPYTEVAQNFVSQGHVEDPDLYFDGGQYHMIVEDNKGKLTGQVNFGAHLVSGDGLAWRHHENLIAYTKHIVFDDGTSIEAERRERPELFNANAHIKGYGPPTHLLNAVLHKGETWNIVQPIAQE